jgi:hypothetical protein
MSSFLILMLKGERCKYYFSSHERESEDLHLRDVRTNSSKYGGYKAIHHTQETPTPYPVFQ